MTGRAEEYVYASPAYGYAQVALAHSAVLMGKRATVFTAKRNSPHIRTLEAKAAGAKIVMVPHGYLSNVQAKARAYSAQVGATLLPFGLDTPQFISGLSDVARGIPFQPEEVWCAAGSGVLCRALRASWPKARICAVQVGCVPKVDNAKLFVAPEKFEQDARTRPPFPSCSNYDAKVWAIMKRHGRRGALLWNVAA